MDVDKTFHEAKNQTSFVKNLGEDGKYGFALAISASTFLISFLIARNYLKKFDCENNDQNIDALASAQLVFSHVNPRASFERRDSTSSFYNSDNSR